jgi:hypothetical protein
MKVITKAILDMETMEWLSVEYFEYEGPIELCCGPSGQEEALASQEGSLSTTMMNAFNDRLATQKDILSQVQDSLGQLKSGNFPPGYSPAIMSTLRSRILNQTSAEARNAQQVAGNVYAGRGGGTVAGAGAASALPSGIQASVAGDIAGTIGAKEADLLSQLQLQNYNVGRENLLASISGLNTLAGNEAPLQFGQAASATTSEAFNQAKTIQQQKNQKWADIAGGITGIAKAGLGLATGGLSTAAGAGLGVLAGGMPGPMPSSTNYGPAGVAPDIGFGDAGNVDVGSMGF